MSDNYDEGSFMLDFIERICEEVGPRPYFTEKEVEGAEYVKKEFEKCTKNVELEKCSARASPTCFDFKLTAIFYVISSILYNFIPLLSSILMLLGLITILLAQIWAIKIFDILAKRNTTQNVIAKIKPKKETKKIIIFGGHIDSTYEFPLMRKFRSKFTILIGGALFFIILIIITSIIKYVTNGFQLLIIQFDWFSIIIFVGLIFVFPLYFMVSNRPVHGANDNLSAVAVCLNLLRKYVDDPPNNVELWFAEFGAEETGRIGSSQFVIKHKEEILDSYTINLETIGGSGELVIVKKEITVPHSMELIELLSEAAEKAGNPMKLYNIPVSGGTDSWSFSKRGLKATAITCLSDTLIPEGWHCREDTPEIIQKDKLKVVSDICFTFIDFIDNNLEN